MNTVRGKLYVAAAFVLAGSSVVAARFISDFLPPFTVTFFSLVFAVAVALPVVGRDLFALFRRLGVRRRRLLFLQALLGIALFRIFLTLGLRHISAAEAGIVTGAAPAITAFFAVIFLRDPLSFRKAFGILLTVAGVMTVRGVSFSSASLGAAAAPGRFGGYLLVLAATACEALFAVFSRKVHLEDPDARENLHPVAHAGIVSAIALGLCLIPMLTEAPWEELRLLPASGWAALVWYGAVVTIVAFTCMFAGAKLCDGYTISAFTGIIPLSSLVLSILLLGNEIAPRQWAGCALIGCAIWVISGGRACLDAQEVPPA